jgi:hypothetical protein
MASTNLRNVAHGVPLKVDACACRVHDMS